MTVLSCQSQTFQVGGNGAAATSTTLPLQSFKDILGVNLAIASFGAVGYGTIEPNTSHEDSITFTGITQNADGSATLTGVASVGFISPYTASAGLRVSHAGSVPFIISNTAAYQATFANKQNVEAITTNWTVPDPVGNTDIANKQYVLSVATGGAVTTDKVIITAQLAGETVAAGNIVYLKLADQRWWKADADLTTTFDGLQLGVALGAGTAGNAITGGVQLGGLCTAFTGLTAGSKYYLSNTAGGVSATAGTYTVQLGTSESTTAMVFNPQTIPSSVQYVPTGAIMPFAGSSAPTNFLLCDGSAVSRTTYATLFATLSTTYGSGNGSTTFNVPDLRARTPIGIGAVTKVATFASRSSNVITVTGLSDTASNEFQTGQKVNYVTSAGAIGGLTTATDYYVVRTGNLTFSLATSLANAQNGTVITLSSDGSGTQTFTLTLSTRTLGETGGEETHAMSNTELLAHAHSGTFITSGSSNNGFASGSSTNTSTASVGSVGGNQAMQNMQPFLGINYIIRT